MKVDASQVSSDLLLKATPRSLFFYCPFTDEGIESLKVKERKGKLRFNTRSQHQPVTAIKNHSKFFFFSFKIVPIHVPVGQRNPGDSDSQESASSAGDPGLIPGLGRSPGEGNGYPLQYSCLENPMDCTVHGATKSQI